MSKKDKKLFNYIVNTLDVSKDMIMNVVDQRLNELFEKHVKDKLDSNRVERLILDRISYHMKNGYDKNPSFFDTSKSFESIVKKCIAEEVTKIVRENNDIEIKIVPKDTQTVKKV